MTADNGFTLSIMTTCDQSAHFNTISCGFVHVVLTGQPIELPLGFSDIHNFYEFLIPLTPLRRFQIEDQSVDCQPGQIVPINPGQRHGVKFAQRDVSYILLLICAERMTRLIRQINVNAFGFIFPHCALPLRPDIQHLISRLIQENKCPGSGCEILMHCLAEELLVLLVRHYYQQPASLDWAAPEVLVGEQPRFRPVINHMRLHYAERLSVEDMAALCNMNCFHFIRTFKRAFNTSPYNYLTQIRLGNARRLLIETRLSIAEVGRRCGFRSPSRFSAVFQSQDGQTPSRFRKEHAKF
ncbi:MAG: helix-turn-helix domain-containing protein [Saccharofermentanales bacterium]|jgi:AraC-like DNA-binding protein|nr:AraC family transcriptional regulator [Clostridiaceae bacterium]